MLPQGAGFTQSLNFLRNANTNSEGPGKIYVGGMPPSLSEPHLHVYFSQFGIVKNVTIVRDHETGKIFHVFHRAFATYLKVLLHCSQNAKKYKKYIPKPNINKFERINKNIQK